MDKLARYYTESIFSDLLIKNISNSNPNTVIDLGIGSGSLTRSAYNRWMNATFYGLDIDEKSVDRINKEFPFIKIVKGSGLSLQIKNELGIDNGTVDVAICNPPYLKIQNKRRFEPLLRESSLLECISLKKLTSDILFLSQNLMLLRDGGELGIILPDSLISGHEFLQFRQALVSNHGVKGIIQLPDRIFFKTEARTHILFLEKGGVTNQQIPIFKATPSGECHKNIMVEKSLLLKRMDFTYHQWLAENQGINRTLNSITTDIKRGNITFKDLKSTRQPYFHTTHFKTKFPENRDSRIGAKYQNHVSARKGDILLARVGKRCVGNVFLVKTGRFLVSDCVYRIRVPKRKRTVVFKAIKSKKGKKWIESFAHGVCSQVISKIDLLNFPV